MKGEKIMDPKTAVFFCFILAATNGVGYYFSFLKNPKGVKKVWFLSTLVWIMLGVFCYFGRL